ncbi:class I SAM-dependent methyltransferase [Fodinicurvata halophila]|uniref:class I SAM-dependent methyltransferase n=1 Tax=Fodinicurvata halophila TaxID=1419723 RepID=UPI00363B126E
MGIDAHGPSIESASKNVPEAEFVHGSWWDVPDDQFDVILLLSAIHYEKNQKKFLEMLLEHLSPKGTLILECGIANEQPNIRRWDTVKRHDGIKKYPTRALLTQDILERFAVRSAGRSVDQAGDPVPRYVFHCTRRQSTALLIPGLSGIGKSQLGTHFANLGTPVYATDSLILRLSKNPNYSWRPLAKAVQDIVVEKGQDWGAVGEKIASDDELGREAVDIIIEEIPKEVPLFIIEGDLLRHEFIISELISRIKTDGIRPWLVSSC